LAIHKIEIANQIKWQKKITETIKQFYKKTPFFEQYFPFIEDTLLNHEWIAFSKLLRYLNNYFLKELDIHTPIIYSSEIEIEGTKSDLVFNLCKQYNTDVYISGPFGKDYLEHKKFEDAGMDIEYHEYPHPEYPQQYGDFIPYLSAIDLLFNCGSGSKKMFNNRKMTTLFDNKKIMIVVAHPDDELLGLGATMHKLIHEHHVQTHVVILGEGITSRSDKRDAKNWKTELETHRQNIKNAQDAIGYHSASIYDLPDNRFDSVDLLDIIKIVEKEKQQFNPDIIFTHHGGDLNIDHQRTFEAVITSCRPMENEKVKGIVTFETPSGTEWRASSDPRHFIPNLFFEVTERDVEAKIKGMEGYEFEKRTFPHPRSPQALKIQAQRWGVVIGVEFAEVFQTIRMIN
jgi:LmbE family N-acetylglucosaminyl deacetylase